MVLTGTAQGYPLINCAVFADFGRFADNHPRTVVDEKPLAYFGAGMNFNTRFASGTLGNKTRQKEAFMRIKPMGSAIHAYSLQTGVK